MNQKERDELRNRFSEKKSIQFKNTTLCGLIALNPKITQTNYAASLCHGLLMGFFANGVELLQQNILVNERYYNLDGPDAIQYNSWITLMDLLLKILVTPFFGVMVDRAGRKKMVFLGYSLIIVSLILFPIRRYSPYFDHIAWFFGVRAIYSNGSAIIPILPFVADFVDNKTKGKAIGFSVLFISIGFTASTLVVSVMADHDPFILYMIFAGVIAVVGFGYALLLKSGNSYYKTPRSSFDVETGHHLADAVKRDRRLTMVKKDFKNKPWIIASYIFAFLNGAATAATSQVLNLYVQSFSNDPEILRSLGAKVVLKANIAGLLASFVLGPTLDKVKPLYIGSLALISSVAAYGSIGAVKDPAGIQMTLIAIGIGITYSCTLLLTKYLGFKNYRTSIRGLLFSIANILIMLGVVSVAVIGGNLFRINRNIPFFIAAGCAGIGALLFLYLYCGAIRKQEKNRLTQGPTAPIMRDNSAEYVMEGEDVDDFDQEQDLEDIEDNMDGENDQTKKDVSAIDESGTHQNVSREFEQSPSQKSERSVI